MGSRCRDTPTAEAILAEAVGRLARARSTAWSANGRVPPSAGGSIHILSDLAYVLMRLIRYDH
jgi:hypothetical protein